MAEVEKKTVSKRWAGLKSEFSKIIWPEAPSVRRQTVAVVVSSIVIALIIVILDYAIQYGIDFLVKL
ncbi:MAG: preprotein translocase subunit SecE [Lachnospiraceae bacterium]|nr:preprotein translocase subunit SecE [Lachnospiraceae bacterium]